MKREEEEEEEEDPPELAALSISTSPKSRAFFANRERDQATSPQQPRGLTSAISMAESLELQRLAAERAAELKAKEELEAQQRAAIKQSIRESKIKNERMMNFLFAGQSDSEEDEDDYSDVDFREEGEVNPSILEEDESHELNPYKTAYTLGWNLAKHEESQHAAGDSRQDDILDG